MPLTLRKEFKEKLVELALLPIGFVAHQIFGKQLDYIHFSIDETPDFFCQEIAKNIEISHEWLEISLNPPIKINKHIQIIQIFIEGYNEIFECFLKETAKPSDAYFFHKPTLPDGTVINPKVQLIDEFQETHNLEFIWHAYCLGFTTKLPSDREYIKLKISCDKPFKSYLIRWFDLHKSKDEK